MLSGSSRWARLVWPLTMLASASAMRRIALVAATV